MLYVDHSAASALTPRELEVLQLGSEDLSARDMAQQLQISSATVRTHLHTIYAKLQVRSRPAAVAKGIRLGLIQ